jgi:hypothetical protein
MTIRKLPGSQIESNTITITQIQTTAVTNIVTQAGPRVTSLVYPGNDTAGNTVGGQTVYINGTGFETNNAIYINGNAVPSKSFISASNLSFTTPALSAGIYPVYVINTDSGSTAIFVPGYIASAEPSWVTASALSEVGTTDAWSISLSATGDAPVTYALAGGSSLPSGISLAANGLISGTLSSPPETDTQYTFTVVATDAQNQDSSRQFTVTTTSGEGVLFANNALLIHADGTNNKNNHTFLDSSNNNFTITRAGNATQGSFSPFSQTGWSNYFTVSSSRMTLATNATFGFGTGNFTIEFWLYYTGGNGYKFFVNNNSGSGNYVGYGLQNGTLTPWVWNNADVLVANTNITTNIWQHHALVRNGSTLTIYLNGVSIGSTTSSTDLGSSRPVYIGWNGGNDTQTMEGYMSNLRIIKGTAAYTSNFTPSTSQLTAIANTSLLTCQNNRFIDNSTNNLAITVSGTTIVSPFSPFAPTAAYSTANVGGSAYFDGTGDYLTVPAGSAFAYGTGDFTVEGWFYATAEPVSYGSALFTQTISGTNYFACFLGSETISPSRVVRFQFATSGGGTAISTSATYNLNSWNHFAIVRNSGSVTVYLNGVGGTSGSCTQNFSDTSYVPTIGSYTHNDINMLTGYLSNFRVVKGTAVYTTNFTPPTAPLTNIANTSLLCNFTNAGIFDHTAKNIIETVGDAKVSTAQYKYGTGSMYFDGTGDYLKVPDNLNLRMESGSFTIEFWWYPVSIASYQTLFDKGYTGAGALLFQTGNGDGRTIIYAGGSSVITSNTAVSTNTWTHIALVRNGSTLTLYQNGNSVGSNTNSTNFSNTSIMGIGGNHSGLTFYGVNGYIDDLRITKGYARYTSNFTAPTSAFKDK